MENKDIVHLKINGKHQIWIFKKLVRGFKYIGIYSKKLEYPHTPLLSIQTSDQDVFTPSHPARVGTKSNSIKSNKEDKKLKWTTKVN